MTQRGILIESGKEKYVILGWNSSLISVSTNHGLLFENAGERYIIRGRHLNLTSRIVLRGLLIESGRERYILEGWNTSLLTPPQPPPQPECILNIYPDSLDFGEVLIDECSSEKIFYIFNTGNATATLNIYLTGPARSNYVITDGAGSVILSPNTTHKVFIKFCPITRGTKLAQLFVETQECDSISGDLKGRGVLPEDQEEPWYPPPGTTPTPEKEENRWCAIGASWKEKKALIAWFPHWRPAFLGGIHSRNIFITEWYHIIVRPEELGGRLWAWNIKKECCNQTIDTLWWCDAAPCFTLGNHEKDGYRIFVASCGGIEEVCFREWDYLNIRWIDIHGIDVRPYDIYWDGWNKQVVAASYKAPYIIETFKPGGARVSKVETDKPLQQCAIDIYHRYWFNEYEGNNVYIFSPNLDLIKVINFPSGACITGISEDSNYNIIVLDKEHNKGWVFYADDDYTFGHPVNFPFNAPHKACPWYDSWVVIACDPAEETEHNFYGFDLKRNEIYKYPSWVYGSYVPAIYGSGDCGLNRWRTWGWNWSPHIEYIQEYVGW